ncbi:hypothetical protein PR202_ga28337 [Eleusine coracana subsp. coracana]|uniref:Uncharacterized protein n=1 Tax=Eleusine coracana subsp. coracana TaxID=191504 RepID=A0AAV5DH42_ELECO|nr:hypothetical protein PR202_ga28337 [Eleusine coracana subsp. coracana]
MARKNSFPHAQSPQISQTPHCGVFSKKPPRSPPAAIGGAMVFLKRSGPVNPRKRPPPPPSSHPPPRPPPAAKPDPDLSVSDAVDAAAALLADAGCTLLVPLHQAPVLPSPLAFSARLARSLAADPDGALPFRLLEGLAAFAAASPARLRQLLLPTPPARTEPRARAPLRARAAAGTPRLPSREAARAF